MPGSIQPEYVPIITARPILKPKPRLVRQKKTSTCDAKRILIEEFDTRKAASVSFPPTLTDQLSRNAIGNFQAHVNRVVADTKDVYSFCGLFITSETSQFVHQGDPFFMLGINSHAFTSLSLDQCGYVRGSFLFCKSCFRYIKDLKFPKFGATNIINVCACQDYPDVFKEITLVEEAVIARAHPIISILKLRPSGASLLASYQRIRGHAVILPQNPGPLLDMLLSNAFLLHEIIRVVWAGKRPYTAADILAFRRVRKEKVLNALLWLKENNPLYGNLTINYQELESWDDEFIPAGISSRVLLFDPVQEERGGYAADLHTDNFENELHHAVDSGGLNDTGFLSGCLYTDANDTRTHPTMKLVSAVTNYKNKAALNEHMDLPVLTYINNGRSTPLNDWNNPNYFTAAFPTLFPFGIGGHLATKDCPRKTKVSLEAWAK